MRILWELNYSIIFRNSEFLCLSILWIGQQEVQHNAGWAITSPWPLNAHVEEGNALVEGAEGGRGGGRGSWGLARLLVFLPG